MNRIPAASATANAAYALVGGLQRRFVDGLEALARNLGSTQRFAPVEWFRDDGRHGGGVRFESADGDLFGRGSVNVSQARPMPSRPSSIPCTRWRRRCTSTSAGRR